MRKVNMFSMEETSWIVQEAMEVATDTYVEYINVVDIVYLHVSLYSDCNDYM